MPSSIAIVGAGCSGLAAAHVLLDAGYSVTLFEKSSVVGGRAATRTRNGFIYDYGANYIKPGAPASVELIMKRFYTPALIDIKKPVWTFDGSEHVQEGDPSQNAEAKWSYRRGLNTLPLHMAEGLNIRRETCIVRIERQANKWILYRSDAEQTPGMFDRLLISIPASQAIELIQASQLSQGLSASICSHLEEARYNALISVLFGYKPRPRVRPYYALINTDRLHAISWLSWEHEKNPERAPADAGLLMAQMGPQYSQEHWQTADEDIYRDVAPRIASLIDEALPEPYFTDIQRWRYALPTQKANADALNSITLPQGLAFCGDGFVGGRVHLALEHGIHVASQLINSQGEPGRSQGHAPSPETRGADEG
ncbi:MAG: FAD-dependent oxidoreductase [Ktedonobacteraceae bacterium]|nr:FAD-dependent oxidoreductase [Ktedonobacteraceae bacterium]